MNTPGIKSQDQQNQLSKGTPRIQTDLPKNNQLIVQGNKAIHLSNDQQQSGEKQNNIRERIFSVSQGVQDAKSIMQNAQIRMLIEEYNMKSENKIKKLKPNSIYMPFLSRSQSSMISSIGATINSQSVQGVIDVKTDDNHMQKGNQEVFIQDQQENIEGYSEKQKNQQEKQSGTTTTQLPTISSKIIARMSDQITKINKNMHLQSKENLYQVQRNFTQSTLPTEQSQPKLNLKENRSQIKIKSYVESHPPQRSHSEKKFRQNSTDMIETDRHFLERETNNSINITQFNDTTAHILTSPSEYKRTFQKRNEQKKPKSLAFIQHLSEYAQQNWTESLNERLKSLDYQNAGKDLAVRGKQLIQLFESFILDEINQCSSEDICMSNSLVLNEMCKLLEDQSLYGDTILKKVKDTRNQQEESEVIELFGYCMKFNNPEHSEEFIEELKSFFERKYFTLIKKLRVKGNSTTQIFIDTLQNVEIFFKLYKDKLTLNQQKVEQLKLELEDAHKLVAALENRAQNSHLVQERTEIEYKMKNREDLLELQTHYEKLYTQRIEDNRASVKKLEQDIDKLKEQLNTKDTTISKQKQEIESYQVTLNKKKVDASTQIQMHIMPYVQNQPQKITPIQQLPNPNPPIQSIGNPFQSFGNEFMSPFTFSKSCSGAFISVLLTECIFYDYSLFHRHKFCSYSPSYNYNHLVNYSHHFFVNKFGNKIIGEIFLKNFVQSLQEYSSEGHLRFLIFSQLTGLEVYSNPNNQNQRSKSPKNNLNRSTLSANSLTSQQNAQQSFSQYIRKMFWESKQSFIIYMRIALLFRRNLLKSTNSQQHSMSGIYSLFDNTELLNKFGQTEGYENATILITRAQPILQDILSEHLPRPEGIFEVFKSFQNYVAQSNSKEKQGLSSQMQEVPDLNASPSIRNVKNKSQQRNQSPSKQNTLNKRVTMDEITMFIIDYLAELKNLQIDRFLASLKIIQSQKKNTNISLKDFSESFTNHFSFSPFMSNSQCFVENLFSKFIMNSTTALSGGDDQRKTALKPFLQALFDEFNDFDNESLTFYITSEFLSSSASSNIERVLSSQKQNQTISRILPSQSSKINKSSEGKRSASTSKKQQQDAQNQKSMIAQTPQLTAEQQVIQTLSEEMFDVPNNIILILEGYEQIKALIKNEESVDDKIKMDHDKFKSLLPQLSKIKQELKQSSENNPTVSAQPRKSQIETVKYVQSNLNSLMLIVTSKLKLGANF